MGKKESERKGNRNPEPLDRFLNDAIARKVQLTRPGLIMVIFYTGPGYMPLNNALCERRYQFGKLSCSMCLKGRYIILTGKSTSTPCVNKCGKCKRCKIQNLDRIIDGSSQCAEVCGTCARCVSNLSDWACKVARKGSLKVVE